MASDRPNFLKAAFLNVYNLGLLGGALAAGALTGDAMLAFLAAGAEALWLIYGPGLRPFQRAVTASACLYFKTVLDPGSDAAHETHLHLDVIERRNDYRYCR